MSAYRYGDSTKKTDRYEMGEVLSRNSEHLLFLTATPHKGDPENFSIIIVMQLSLIMDETWSKNVEPLYYMIGI